MAAPLWQPSPERVAGSQQSAFAREVEQAWGADGSSQAALHRFSIEQPGPFWESVWRFCQVIGERGEGEVLVDGDRMPGARWFPGARLNFAENLLRRRDDAPALLFRSEAGNR